MALAYATPYIGNSLYFLPVARAFRLFSLNVISSKQLILITLCEVTSSLLPALFELTNNCIDFVFLFLSFFFHEGYVCLVHI